MNIKKYLAVLCSAVFVLGGALSVYADDEQTSETSETSQTVVSSEEQSSETQEETTVSLESESETTIATTAPEETQTQTTTTTTAQTTAVQTETTTAQQTQAETTTQSQTTTEAVEPDTPTAESADISLDISKVKNGKFTAALKISSESSIGEAEIWLEYDPKLIKYVSNDPNYDLGANFPVDDSQKGKVKLGYINEGGIVLDTVVTTATFKIVDNTFKSTAIYVDVDTLTTPSGANIPYNQANGVVENNEAEDAKDENGEDSKYQSITVAIDKSPVTFESLGIKNVKDCMIENSDILEYKDGMLNLLNIGQSRIEVTYKDGKNGYFLINVVEGTSSSESQNEAAAVTDTSNSDSKDGNKWIIVVAVLLAVAILAFFLILYFMIIRPKKLHNAENIDDYDDYEQDDHSDYSDEDEYADEYEDGEEYEEYEDEYDGNQDQYEEYDNGVYED